jgi:nucleoid DNA-binding protein
MNKTTLESAIAAKLGVTKDEAAKIVKTVVDTVVEGSIADGESVIPGLGKLKVVDKPETSGETFGKLWNKPAHKVFKLLITKEGEVRL